MSITKNALIRYQTLDKCFRNDGRMYFIEDLLKECNNSLYDFNLDNTGISIRQLYDDIRFMESDAGWSIPLKRYRYGRKKFYRYENTSFSINNQPLKTLEADQIRSALQIISRFQGIPQFEWVNEMIPLLESKFDLRHNTDEIISFQLNTDLRGYDFINPLYNAIVNERVLLIKYKDFKSAEAYDILFHPYYLKQYNNRWFSFGLNSENQMSNWNLALDRIESISETDEIYEKSDINWGDYFFDIIGVTRPLNTEEVDVILLFSHDVASYVKTKPLHGTQKSHYKTEGLEVIIKVIPNFELEQLILSFGEHVKVLYPTTLKNSIKSRLKLANKNYD